MSGANASPIGRSQEEKSLARNGACERPPRLRLLRWLRAGFASPLNRNLAKPPGSRRLSTETWRSRRFARFENFFNSSKPAFETSAATLKSSEALQSISRR